jgi:hypothetical protein
MIRTGARRSQLLPSIWLRARAAFTPLVMLVGIVLLAGPALAQDPGANTSTSGGDTLYPEALKALTVLFVTAVLLESAFSVIFNWRVFLAYFSSRGVRTIIMVVVSLVIVNIFELDILADLIRAYTKKSAAPEMQPVSTFVTALILAGGSAGVYNILVALGYREKREEVAPKPSQNEAWIAIRVKKQNAVGEIQVLVEPVNPLPAGPNPPAIAGTIGFRRPGLFELLLRNANRFPQNGGYVVQPNVPYLIEVEGRDANGTPLKRLGGRSYVFAPRAIVDFDVTM